MKTVAQVRGGAESLSWAHFRGRVIARLGQVRLGAQACVTNRN